MSRQQAHSAHVPQEYKRVLAGALPSVDVTSLPRRWLPTVAVNMVGDWQGHSNRSGATLGGGTKG
jgi:hypothetical protein